MSPKKSTGLDAKESAKRRLQIISMSIKAASSKAKAAGTELGVKIKQEFDKGTSPHVGTKKIITRKRKRIH